MNQKKFTIYQPSVGIGIKVSRLVIDYAFTSLQTQASPLYTHVFSLRLLFDKPASAQKEQTPITSPATSTEQ